MLRSSSSNESFTHILLDELPRTCGTRPARSPSRTATGSVFSRCATRPERGETRSVPSLCCPQYMAFRQLLTTVGMPYMLYLATQCYLTEPS
jgi:hypothetical protein